MLVQDIMHRTVVTVGPGARLAEVARLLQSRGIRHLPVLDGEALVGIISDRDLKAAMGSAAAGLNAAFDRLAAGDIMTKTVITTAPMFPVEEAARVMVTEKISALPVTEGERMVGLITETDLLLLLVRAMGVLEPSSRLDVELPATPRALGRVVQTLESEGAPVSSIMTLKSPTTAFAEAVIRVTTINPGRAIGALEAQGYTVRDWTRSGTEPRRR
jgi:acetoin utilization protein AcuB